MSRKCLSLSFCCPTVRNETKKKRKNIFRAGNHSDGRDEAFVMFSRSRQQQNVSSARWDDQSLVEQKIIFRRDFDFDSGCWCCCSYEIRLLILLDVEVDGVVNQALCVYVSH